MPHVFLPQHHRQLRRRNNAHSNTASSSNSANISRSSSRCPGLQFTCLLLGVIGLTTLMFVSNFSNHVRQHQSDLIKLDTISSTINNDATAIILPPPSSSSTTSTTTSAPSHGAETYAKETKTPLPLLSHLPPCDDDCQIHRRQRLDQSGGVDLLSVTDMISSVQAKKQALLDILGTPNQYGDLAGQLFNTRSGTQSSLSSQLLEAVDAMANPSRDRLRDKLQRKLLQVQLEIIQQDNRPTIAAVDAAAAGSTDYDSSIRDYLSSSSPVQNEQRLLRQQSETLQQADTDPSSMDEYGEATVPASRTLSSLPYKFTQTRLIWATAGHGASAGHGNLAEESYTAILEQAARPVFGAAGIELTTRNYGWAGTTDKSAPELALCLDSVYGTDVDILAWDFEESALQASQHSQHERQQREREHGWKRHMFWARAALQANRPAVVAMNLNDVPMHVQDGSSDGSSRHPILRELDQLGAHGLTALGWNPDVMAHIHEHIIPDANDLLPGEDKITPANVRFFKCGGQVESGLVCEDERFSDHADKNCRNLWYRDASNPGWKQHALTGNLMALFLVDILLEALQELELSTEDLAARLARLEAVEEADNERFRSEAPLPRLPTSVFNPSDFSITANLFQKRSLCHTARLPSEMRYRGILTGRTTQEFDHFYREGMEREKADKLMSTMFDEGADVDSIESEEMKLVYSEALRQTRCNATLNIDYPDSFYVGPNEGWKSLKIMTRFEKETYKIDSPEGLIIACLVQPNLYRKGFNAREIQVGDMKKHPLVSFRVNGQAVEALSWIDSCFILNGAQGHYWEIGSDGQYEIEARVGNNDDADHDILQISSVIVL